MYPAIEESTYGGFCFDDGGQYDRFRTSLTWIHPIRCAGEVPLSHPPEFTGTALAPLLTTRTCERGAPPESKIILLRLGTGYLGISSPALSFMAQIRYHIKQKHYTRTAYTLAT